MAPKRLSDNPPSASSSSGEEGEETAREDNHVSSDSDSDSETESDNNVSAFRIIPIKPKSTMPVDVQPEKSGDSKVIDAAAADETPKKKKKKNKKMKAEKGKSSDRSKKLDQKSSYSSKKVNPNVSNTDVADVEMAEPTCRILLGLPCKQALDKKPRTPKAKKLGKSKDAVKGDEKIESLIGGLRGKRKIELVGNENEKEDLSLKKVSVKGDEKIESLIGGSKGKLKIEAMGNENEKEDLSLKVEKKVAVKEDEKIESLIEGLKGKKKVEEVDGKGVWWEDLSKIEIQKAEELKKKWKKLKEEELKFFIMKNELLNESAIAVIDGMKVSPSS